MGWGKISKKVKSFKKKSNLNSLYLKISREDFKNVLSVIEKMCIENINLTLRTYTGGYQRFEQDNYRNGAPWVIANLWMTLYYLENGEKKKAKETFDFVLKTAGKHSLLGEQIDNNTLKPNWVIGLGWSHAMFVIVLEKLYGKK